MIIHISKYATTLQYVFMTPCSCKVHSVFDNTINVQYNERLLTLNHRDSPMTPMSINLDVSAQAFQSFQIKQHDFVMLSKEGIQIANDWFVRGQHQEIDLSYSRFEGSLDDDSLIILKENIFSFMMSTSTKGVLLSSLKYIFNIDQKDDTFLGNYVINMLMEIEAAKQPDLIVDKIASLLGLGEGLTPSGDDFICGVLAMWCYLSNEPTLDQMYKQLSQKVKQSVNKTTTVSKDYLLYATEGLFNEYVMNLFIEHRKNQPYLKYLHKISTLGHSSGTDFLVGMYFGLKTGGIQK